MVKSASSFLDYVSPELNSEFIDIIDKFCLTNSYFSQALKNIMLQGNTGHTIEVVASSESVVNSAGKELTALSKKLNIDDQINQLFRQIGVSGALSAEWVPEKDLSGVKKLVRVPAKSITFKYDKKDDEYVPHQKSSSSSKTIELNTTTYSYIPLESPENSPYGIPPFISALPAAVINIDIMENIKFIIKKLGLLGFITAAIDLPDKDPNETDDDYKKKLSSYLEEFGKSFADNYRDGVAVHYDNIKITHNDSTGDNRAVDSVVKVVEEGMMSGLNQVPALFGKSNHLTETYAKIFLEKFKQDVDNYRRLIARFIAKGYELHLFMRGIPVDEVIVNFLPDKSITSKEDAEAEKVRRESAVLLMNELIISPDEAARECDYPSAYISDIINPVEDEEKLTHRSTASFKYKNGIYIKTPPRVKTLSLDPKKDDERDPEGIIERKRMRFTAAYKAEAMGIENKALDGIMRDFGDRLTPFLRLDAEQFADEVYNIVTELHPSKLREYGISDAVHANMLLIYRYYRVQDRLFKGKRFPINFTLPDERAIEFAGKLDDFYFSKHLNNKPARSRMLKFIAEEHLSGNTENVGKFMKTFRKELGDLTSKQVDNIIDTSVTRLRGWGHVRQLSEARLYHGVISEVMDSITCPLCREMHGKEIRIDRADLKLQELSFLSAQEYHDTVFENSPEEWRENPVSYAKNHSMDDFIEFGILTPPFHGHCRGRIKWAA